MSERYMFATASEALPFLCSRLLEIGDEHVSRNGPVKEFLNTQIVLTNPTQREILSLGRKANVFAQIAETCWVLAGRNDIEWLSAYLPRAVDYSDDGETWRGGYGPRIREWHLFNGKKLDQLAHVVDTLRADPLSRRAVIGIYDPALDVPAGKDVPCNDFLQFQSRLGELHLTVTVRSNDLMWGWSGINAFEWSVLQEIVASLLGVRVGTLTFNIGSLHLYQQHWNKASRIEYDRIPTGISTPFNPGRNITTLVGVDDLLSRWFEWEAKCRTGDVGSSNAEEWPDPLFQAWAAAIAYYWTRDDAWLAGIQGTALAVAIARTPASVLSEPVQRSSGGPVGVGATGLLSENAQAFYEFVSDLHAKKHQSYGDSWKKRGEKLSILANIARKVDRLGIGDEFDSAADTWIDLMVYLAKYLCWINGSEADPKNVDFLVRVALLNTEETHVGDLPSEIESITASFDNYADYVDTFDVEERRVFVRDLLRRVAPIARDVWANEHPIQDPFDEYRGADVD